MKIMILFFSILGVMYSVFPQNRLYVNHMATGTNNGTSWSNACTNLHNAPQAAQAGATVWVKPTSDTDAIPLCIPEIGGTVEDELNATVDLVEVDIRNTSSPASCLKATDSGCTGYATCVCGYDDYVITPSHNQNHLNGVSTYDMVLISKHILGVEYFPALWQRVAADADWSGTVNTSDIISIRKVILGIESIFDNDLSPHDASWRFYPETYTLPTPMQTNELPSPIFEDITVTVTSMGNSPLNLDFKAVKVGDINSTHIANACRPASRPGAEQANAGGYPVGLLLSAAARSGDYITLPMVNEGADMMEGFQACFRFDPGIFEFVGASQGDVEGINPDCFGLHELERGIIRMAWLSPDMEGMLWKPGQVLCHFTFRAKRKTLDMAAPLALDQNILACQAYAGDRIYDLELLPAQSVSGRQPLSATAALFNVQCRPNPAVGDAGLLLDMPEASEKIKIAVFSAFGQRLFFRQMDLPAGRSDIALPEAAQWAPGVYTWRVWNKSGRQEGKLIKQ